MRFPTSLRILSVLMACGLILGATEPGPREFELEDDLIVTGRVHDVQRSLQRYPQSAYGVFMGTRTGQFLAGQLVNGLENVTDGQRQRYVDIAKQVTAVGYTLSVPPANFEQGALFQAAIGFTDVTPFKALLDQFAVLQAIPGAAVPSWHPDGEADVLLEQHGNLLALAAKQGGVTKIHQTPIPADPFNADADAEFLVDIGKFMQGLNRSQMIAFMMPREWQEFMKQFEDFTLSVDAKLAPCGVEETLTYRLGGWLNGIAVKDLPLVDKAVFDALPPTTIMAMAWQSDPRMMDLMLAKLPPSFVNTIMGGDHDAALKAEGLPPFIDCLKSFSGPGVAYIESIDGKPAFSVVLGVDDVVGAKMAEVINQNLAALANEPCPPEVLAVMGYEPKPVVACVDGELILTVHPNGIKAVTDRAGGFSQQPAVQEALVEVPTQANSIAVSNSPESWRFVGDMILKIMDQNPRSAVMAQMVATLPDDLATAAKHGYLYALFNEDGGVTLKSAGMITPTSGYTLGLGGLAVFGFWMQRSQVMMMNEGFDVPAPPPAF